MWGNDPQSSKPAAAKKDFLSIPDFAHLAHAPS